MRPEIQKRFAHLLGIEALLTLAGQTAGVFSIVYLVRSSIPLLEASIFYVEGFAVTTLLCLVVSRTGIKHPKRWMALGMLSLSLFYLSFLLLRGRALVLIAPLFFGPYIVGFWVPFNTLMLRLTSKRNRGVTIGIFFLVFPLIGVAGPLASGYIITNIGYELIFALATAALLCNAALILLSHVTASHHMSPRISVRGLGTRLSLALFFEGGQEGVWFTALPLLSLLFAEGEMVLGVLFSLFALAGGIASVVAAHASDKTGDRARYVRAGALLSAPFILGAALAPEILTYAAATSVTNLLIIFVPVFLFALAADRMEGDLPTSVLTRETLLNAGRVVGGVFCALALLTGGIRTAYALSALFVIGAAAAR
ncbi:MAG: hypothetical protein AB1665_04750 [Candidatus Thermoplasmatota archaeon]